MQHRNACRNRGPGCREPGPQLFTCSHDHRPDRPGHAGDKRPRPSKAAALTGSTRRRTSSSYRISADLVSCLRYMRLLIFCSYLSRVSIRAAAADLLSPSSLLVCCRSQAKPSQSGLGACCSVRTCSSRPDQEKHTANVELADHGMSRNFRLILSGDPWHCGMHSSPMVTISAENWSCPGLGPG